jgi:hypothetical protein
MYFIEYYLLPLDSYINEVNTICYFCLKEKRPCETTELHVHISNKISLYTTFTHAAQSWAIQRLYYISQNAGQAFRLGLLNMKVQSRNITNIHSSTPKHTHTHTHPHTHTHTPRYFRKM